MGKKVLIICHSMTQGGVCIAAKNFIENMKKEYDIKLVLAKKGGELEDRLPSDIEVSYIPYPLSILANSRKEAKEKGLKQYFFRSYYGVLSKFFGKSVIIADKLAKKSAKENKYDIIINNDMDLWKRGLAACHPYAKNVQAKLKILVIHGDFEKNNYDEKFFKKEYLPVYNKIVLLSKKQQEYMVQKFPDYKYKFVVAGNFQSIDEIINLSNEGEADFSKNTINFISVSRLVEVKGYLRALECLKKLKEEGFNFFWHVIGEGEQHKIIQEFISKNKMDDCVKLYGFKKNPYPYIKKADFLALLSYHEAQGLVALESLVLHKPVLITETIGSKDVVKKNEGIICKNSDEGVYLGLKEMFIRYKSFQKNVENYCFNTSKIKEQWRKVIND